MRLAENFCAVGIAEEKDALPCVIVLINGMQIRLPEPQARKLADDILRNANYLWPIEEKNT